MGLEIERKFLVTSEAFAKAHARADIHQGYLEGGVRVRISVAEKGDIESYLTIKGPGNPGGMTRKEFEYTIPSTDAAQILTLCKTQILKRRHFVQHEWNLWMVDEFVGLNEGLVVAEIELVSETEAFPMPPWVGTEVTADPRYSNWSLSRLPFTRWESER